MLDWLRRMVLIILRVPPKPEVPEGSPGSVIVFRAGRNFYRRCVIVWTFSHLGVLAGLLFAYFFTWRFLLLGPQWVHSLVMVGEILGLFGILVALPFTFLALKWDYELRWYIVTDRSLRIRSGVWNVEELTVTFANIQEIRVTSGPLQNFLGLADVEVSIAGAGTSGPHGQRQARTADFQDVDNANEIRDLMVERLRAYRDLGLGDNAQQQPHQEKVVTAGAILAASQAVLAEARALRSALAGSSS